MWGRCLDESVTWDHLHKNLIYNFFPQINRLFKIIVLGIIEFIFFFTANGNKVTENVGRDVRRWHVPGQSQTEDVAITWSDSYTTRTGPTKIEKAPSVCMEYLNIC